MKIQTQEQKLKSKVRALQKTIYAYKVQDWAIRKSLKARNEEPTTVAAIRVARMKKLNYGMDSFMEDSYFSAF